MSAYAEQLAEFIAAGYNVCIECGDTLPDQNATDLYCKSCKDER
jgi:hypothetical protein